MLLLRLSPVVSYVLLNYVLGISRVRFRDYLLGSIGMLPTVVAYVYAGKVAGDVASLAGGAAAPRGPLWYVAAGARARGDDRRDRTDRARRPQRYRCGRAIADGDRDLVRGSARAARVSRAHTNVVGARAARSAVMPRRVWLQHERGDVGCAGRRADVEDDARERPGQGPGQRDDPAAGHSPSRRTAAVAAGRCTASCPIVTTTSFDGSLTAAPIARTRT